MKIVIQGILFEIMTFSDKYIQSNFKILWKFIYDLINSDNPEPIDKTEDRNTMLSKPKMG